MSAVRAPRGSELSDSADGGSSAREAADRNVLESLQTLTAWFAPLMLLFAALDWLILPAPRAPQEADPRLIVSTIALAVSLALAGFWLWLRRNPPPLRYVNATACGVGAVGMVRALSYLVASPAPLRVMLLAVLLIGAGSVLLSRRWFAGFVLSSLSIWYAAAYFCDPEIAWIDTWVVAISSVAIGAVVLVVRRRSLEATLAARRLDRRLSKELAMRVRLGETLAAISARFLTLPAEGFDVAVELSLRELGRTLRADHAFVCRVDRSPLRTSVIYEWAAPGIVPRGEFVQNAPLEGQDWFRRRLLAGEVTHVSDVALLPFEAAIEREALMRLGAVAFLSVPLIRKESSPWGYFGLVHDSRPMEWTGDEVNLLKVVGDIFLSTMERLRAEMSLRESESRFRRLFDANIIGVFFSDDRGMITDANDAFLEIAGLLRGDLPLPLDELTPPEWRGRDEAVVTRLAQLGVDPPREQELLNRSGSRIPVLIGGALLSRATDECVFFVLDLRQRKEAERKIQRLNAELERAARLGTMGEMAAGLAHEVHQPLAAISNWASGARRRLARGQIAPDELESVFAEIAGQCDRAGAVIRNVRAFVRGRHPGRRAVDLNATLLECLQLARFDIRQRDAEVETDLADDLPAALTDATQLSQILLNLVLNALQSMDAAAGRKTLMMRTARCGDGAVELRVRDSGSGIAPEIRERIFDQFFTTKPSGLGMGLALSRTIAESHSGSLDLMTTGSSGSEFRLILPVAQNGVSRAAVSIEPSCSEEQSR